MAEPALDLLVIGAGLSGLSAALFAAQAGLGVRVVARGLGALHWIPATLDLLGYRPGREHAVTQPLTAFDALPAEHPYRRMGAEAVAAALDGLAQSLAQAGLPYAGHAGRQNIPLPSPAGVARPVYLAPAAQLAGRLDDPAPLLIVGFQGMRDFYPTLAAHHLAQAGVQARAVYLPYDLITDRRDANNVHLAQELEAPARRQALAHALRGLVAPGERIGLPAILGIDQHVAVWRELEAAVGAPVFEIPTLPPSVPGIRLHRVLVQQISLLGGRVEPNMAVTDFAAAGDHITWVETATSARPLRHHAKAFLLATGGILGGGFQSDPSGRVWETIFGLSLTVPQGREHWFRPAFLDPQGHPVYQGGVQTGVDFRPAADGAPRYANLWAAGSVLAHADPIHERSREGLAVACAAGAVQAILAHLGHPAAIPASRSAGQPAG
ncbi:MAG: anaerobic glycerol-3-phosphate dehydrogenase subunit B [Caldilineaceae bacterium]|nr:anaerobic glycerol-3-phosphate dehydrogenase subunit B [Caldilineaceae bacterium]